MATVATHLGTFAEFERMPNPSVGRYELRSGEVFLAPPPELPHHLLQARLRNLLQSHCLG
jgi:hypothetical protein